MRGCAVKGQDGVFAAYIARPKILSARETLAVLQELFGVNADIRKKCDELAALGFLPPLRQICSGSKSGCRPRCHLGCRLATRSSSVRGL